MTETIPGILVVDDDEAFRLRLVRAFRDRGHRAEPAGDYESALSLAHSFKPNRAVVDLRMPDKSGLEVVRDLAELLPGIECLVLTGYGSIATATEAIRLGAVDYLTKPADADQILGAFGRQGAGREGEELTAPPIEAPSLERVEWEHIQRVLADTGGNVSQAARVLGIHRRSLQRKLARRPPHK
ncbi:MAG: response regulator [Planctomycetes bacterium]|nr:response regulator [Planctomycetota bacterium]